MNKPSVQDLKNILASRENSYSRAQYQLDTSNKSLDLTFIDLRDLVLAILPPKPSTKSAL